MDSTQTTTPDAKYLKIASLIIPILITCIVPICLFSKLSLFQLIGSGIILLIIALSLSIGKLKNLPDKDISTLWAAVILYNLYLVIVSL